MINWDPIGKTALSNEEVIHKESNGKLWYLKYPIKDSNDFLVVATTRPETMLGDTGVAVNPNDKRYKSFIGKKIILPIVNKEIPIFSDEYVDMGFGTGCVKITPAHDPNDFVMGQRHNLEIINIMNDDGTLNNYVPERFQNLDRFIVRDKIIEELSNNKILIKTENHLNKVGYSERTDAVVEPRLSKQWFLKMESFSKPALDVVKNKKIKFHPNRWVKIYNHWLENIQDWCISRQLWWGHRIPVWYKGDEIHCSVTPPEDDGWVQDKDVLDTWFSSWVWPIATLGWPNNTPDLKKFYPTQDLVTGPDIIFFWVARMIMSGLYFQNKIPFSNVYFTSIIRDENGKKMSKSLGNSPDPIDLFNKYGVDAVRVSILMMAPQGSDIQFSEDRLDQGKNFMNKLWNSSRFIFMNLDNHDFPNLDSINKNDFDSTDYWILSKFNKLVLEINNDYKNYKLNDVIKKIYNFIWKDYCDWYIEFSKSRIYGKDNNNSKVAKLVLVHVLKNILKLLHPYAPFITEEIWANFNSNELLINASWPKCDKIYINDKHDQDIDLLMEIISAIRNMKIDLGISSKKRINIVCRSDKKGDILTLNQSHLKYLLNVNKIEVGENINKPSQSATIVIKNLEIFLPLKGLIDFKKELNRLKSKMNDLESRIKNIKKKIDNKNFISKAPQNIIEHEKNKYNSYVNDFEKIKNNYLNLNNS